MASRGRAGPSVLGRGQVFSLDSLNLPVGSFAVLPYAWGERVRERVPLDGNRDRRVWVARPRHREGCSRLARTRRTPTERASNRLPSRLLARPCCPRSASVSFKIERPTRFRSSMNALCAQRPVARGRSPRRDVTIRPMPAFPPPDHPPAEAPSRRSLGAWLARDASRAGAAEHVSRTLDPSATSNRFRVGDEEPASDTRPVDTGPSAFTRAVVGERPTRPPGSFRTSDRRCGPSRPEWRRVRSRLPRPAACRG